MPGLHPALAVFDTPRRIAALLLVSTAFLLAFHLPGTGVSQADLTRLSAGEGLLDVRPFYSAAQAQAAVHAWGEAGRALVSRFLLVDGLFILCYSLGLSLWMRRLCPAAPLAWLPQLPQCLAVADALEDACTASLLWAYPAPLPVVAASAGWLTLGKQLLSLGTLAALVWLLSQQAWRARRGASGRRDTDAN